LTAIGEQPPQRSTGTVAPTSRRNGRRRNGARSEKAMPANGGQPTNGRNGRHAEEVVEQSLVFVCSHCSESFASREDLLAHRAAEPQLEALADAAAAVLLSELRSSARARLEFAALFATFFALYAMGRALQVPYLALVGELGVLLFGVGAAPLQVSRSARLAARLGVAGLVMLSSMSLLGVLMVLEPLGQPWHPFLWAAAALATAALAHGVGVRRALSDLRIVGRRAARAVWSVSHAPQGGGWAPLTATVLGTAAWLAAAIMAGHIPPGVAGFLPHIPPVWYAGVASLIVAVFLAHGKREVYVTLAVLSLVLALSVTPALVYAMPRSQSAAKHIEFVQLILAQHRLSTGSGIYATYSAFFAGIAWLCSVARVSDVTGLATWWPVFIGLVGLAELRLLFGRLSSSGYRCWAAIMIVVLVNSIGADYFSPQSIGFVMGLGIYALVLSRGGPPPVDGRLRIALLVFSGCALATTHELSPFIVGGVWSSLRCSGAPARVGRPSPCWCPPRSGRG
jgi:hypothetical protein